MWSASLADGGTVRQDDREGELSSWQKLKQERPGITQLRLQIAGVTLICLPRAQGYVYAQTAEMQVSTGKSRVVRTGVGSIIGDFVLMTWVDESRNVWQDVQPVKDFELLAIFN